MSKGIKIMKDGIYFQTNEAYEKFWMVSVVVSNLIGFLIGALL